MKLCGLLSLGDWVLEIHVHVHVHVHVLHPYVQPEQSCWVCLLALDLLHDVT